MTKYNTFSLLSSDSPFAMFVPTPWFPFNIWGARILGDSERPMSQSKIQTGSQKIL